MAQRIDTLPANSCWCRLSVASHIPHTGEPSKNVFSDAPRAGAYGKFTAEQMTQIMAIACESPEHSGRRVMRRGNFKSLAELKDRLVDFIGYFNLTFAKPFKWN